MSGRERPVASVVDVFCGVGGLSYGFKQAGFDICTGIDVDEECRHAYEKNIGTLFLRKDVSELCAETLKKLYPADGGTRKVLVGCAPCQPFSTYNQKNDNPQWRLLERFGELIAQTSPDVISMENVPRLVKFKGGDLFDGFVEKLKDAGYHVSWDILYGPDYGLAQTRSRLVLLASLLGKIDLPKPTHEPESYRTVEDEIGGLPRLSHGDIDENDELHRASSLSTKNQRRIASSKPGGTWRDWDDDLVTECHKAETGKGYSSVYGRMEWDKPSPTMTTQFYGFGNGRFGHPDQDRAISLREGAMLQGFPRDYQFTKPGAKIRFKSVGRMIGNAVPVMLATAIAHAVRAHLEAHAT